MKVAYTGWTWITHREPEYAKRDLEQSFKELKFLDYDYVENFAFISDFYSENPQELVELAEKYDVKIVNLYGHFTFNVEEVLEKAKKQVKFLSEIGGKWYNCQNAGFGDDGPPERPTDAKMVETMCRIANELGKYAKSLGVTVCFHPHYGTCVFTQEDIDLFLANTNPEYVSLCVDTAHSVLAGIDPAALIRQYKDRVAYIHLKDVDTHALSKAEGPAKMGTFRALGQGTVNFPAVIDALKEIGYDDVVCVELDRPAVSNFQSAQYSRNYIKNVLGM
ncbi:MAG: TIM barrel protein [Clostridiales bacterium]|jgi:inosose dehydratase|nr:TIM barrel protein [Clostridiales bacterium]